MSLTCVNFSSLKLDHDSAVSRLQANESNKQEAEEVTDCKSCRCGFDMQRNFTKTIIVLSLMNLSILVMNLSVSFHMM